jgi:hypothetical protein
MWRSSSGLDLGEIGVGSGGEDAMRGRGGGPGEKAELGVGGWGFEARCARGVNWRHDVEGV